MPKLFFFLCFMLFTFFCYAQPVYISIENQFSTDGTEVWFGRSVDGSAAHCVSKYDNAIFKNGKTSKSFFIDTTMWILVSGTNIPQISLVICKGDSIHIQIIEDAITKEKKVRVNGSNAAGYRNYCNNKLFRAGRIIDKEVLNVLENIKNPDSATIKTEQLKTDLFYPMDSLFKLKAISNDYYRFIKQEGNSRFLYTIFSLAGGWIIANGKSRLKLSYGECVSLLKIYFAKYDPFYPEYRNVSSLHLSLNTRNKCQLINKGIITPTPKRVDVGLPWESSDSVCTYAPVEIQEIIFARNLILGQEFGIKSKGEGISLYGSFKKVFPNSGFLPFIEGLLGQGKTTTVPAYTFGSYSASANSFVSIGVDSLVSLPNFLQKHLPGKAVLVDMWATWCSPCKQEFAYAKDLNDFLKQHDIAMLYFSVDYANIGDRWVRDIKSYKLDGFHYLATDSVTSKVNTLLGGDMSIPHYLLFDKEGNIIDNNLPGPSSGKQLFDLILNKLTKYKD